MSTPSPTTHGEQCPGDGQLSQLVGGTLEHHVEAELDTHVNECTLCQQRLERLTDSEQINAWRELLQDKSVESDIGDQAIPITERTVDPMVDDQTLKDAFAQQGLELVEMIGQGGMGVVYLARQRSPERLVAVKMLTHTHPEEKHVERFVGEANAIAHVKHPNVLEIYQTGSCAGRPFLVLEYVPGFTLESRIEHDPQEARDAALLMIDVANGVGAAHTAGILHRDLKPGNLLLAERAGSFNAAKKKMVPTSDRLREIPLSQFVPKVADFGLAKSFAKEETERLTATRHFMGTPSYMSPEQITGRRDLIDQRSDIYSLGVILYQLLTGFLPFRAVGQYQLLKKIESAEPIPIRQANRQVPKELAAICMKCMEKEPAARYHNCAALIDDLQRFIDGRQVMAKPDSSVRKTVKWCKRKPVHATLAVTIALAIVAGLVSWTWFTSALSQLNANLFDTNEELRDQKSVVEGQLKRIKQEQQISAAIGGFLQNDLLRQAAAEAQYDSLARAGLSATSFSKNPSLIELLDRVAVRLDGDPTLFGDMPTVKVSLMRTVGETYHAIGRYGKAQNVLQKAVALAQTVENGSDEWAFSLHGLALTHFAKGNWSQAQGLFKEAKQIMVESGVNHSDRIEEIDLMIVEINLQTGQELERAGRVAGTLYRDNQVDEILETPFEGLGFSSRAMRIATTYARTCLALERYDEGVNILQKVADMAKESLGRGHPVTIAANFELGRACFQALQIDRAENIYQKVWTQAQATYESDHPTLLYYQVFAAQAMELDPAGESPGKKQANSIAMLEHALEIFEQVHQPSHPAFKETVVQLSRLYCKAERFDEAIALVEQLLQFYDSPDAQRTIGYLVQRAELAKCYMVAGRLGEAEAILKDCLERCRNRNDRAMGLETDLERELGEIDLSRREYASAITRLESVYESQKRRFGNAHHSTMETGLRLVRAYTLAGDYTEVEKFLVSFLGDLEGHLPDTDRTWITLKQGLAMALMYQQKWEQAEATLSGYAESYTRKFPDSYISFRFMTFHGAALIGCGRFDDAEKNVVDCLGGS